MDTVEVIVEKEKYVKDGVHKGMQGWICYPKASADTWLINFPQCGEKDDIATISIEENDLKQINGMDAKINEQIKEKFKNL